MQRQEGISHQQRDHSAGVVGQVLNDLCPPIGSYPEGATVHLLWQHSEDFYEEGHGADVVVVPKRGGQRHRGLSASLTYTQLYFFFVLLLTWLTFQ